MLHQIVDAELHLTYFGGKEYIYLRPPTTYDSLRYDGLRRVDIVASTRSPEQTVPPILTTIRIPAPDWAQPPIGLSSSIKDSVAICPSVCLSVQIRF